MKLLSPSQDQGLALPLYSLRSRLYCLQPVGIEAQLTESLIGFTTRLAEAHCLSLGVLMEKEIAPIIGKTHGGGNIHKIYNYTAALNGTGAMALSLASALEKLTRQKNLHLLTLAPWSELMPSRGLLRQTRAWCPHCYETWRTTEHVIYEPLLWSLSVAKACPLHHCLLCDTCSHCHQKNLPLAWHSRSGYCSKCQTWLGSTSTDLINNSATCTKDELGALTWIANSVGDLLASTPQLASAITKESLAQAFKAHINLVSNGNVAEFARQLQLPKNTVWLWCNGRNLPKLDIWAQVCYRLNRPLLEFITQAPEATIGLSMRKAPESFKLKPKAEARVINASHLGQQLESILLSPECPPPSMREVARRLELHRETISKLFPETSRAISARYDKFQKDLHYQTIEQVREEIKQIVLRLYSEGLCPSEGRIAQIVSRPGYLRYKQVRAAIAEAKLEFSTQSTDSPNF